MYVKFADLPVRDQDRAVEFYTTHFGMVVEKDASYGSEWRWIELAMPGGQTNLLMSESTLTDRSDSPNLVLMVDGIESIHTALCEAEVEILQSPQVSKWNPSEISMMLYDSEDNLILVTSDHAATDDITPTKL